MSTSALLPWDSLENRRATAFLIAGLLWLADTTLLLLELFAGLSVLGTRGPVNAILFMSGLEAAIFGLLGFYTGLVRRMRRVSLISVGVITVAGIAIPIWLVWFLIGTLGNVAGPGAFLGILTFVTVALGFILFGIASVRTGIPSRAVGVLVLAVPTAILSWLMIGFVVYGGDVPAWISPAIGVVMSVLLLATGARLWSEDTSTDHAKPAPEGTSSG